MASIFLKRGKWWIRVKGDKAPDKWSSYPTDYPESKRDEALRYAKTAQRDIDKRRGIQSPDAITLREWAKRWLEKRSEAGKDWKKERGRLDNHVMPVLGGVDLRDLTVAQIADLVHDLRYKSKLAGRTVRNIYGVLAVCLRDAVIAGKLPISPCQLAETQLPPIEDKDPEWRGGALFTRKEAETMISDRRIPLDRQMSYGFGLLAGLRPGEAAALRWRHYDPTCEPLGKLTVATSYSTTYSKTKSTKTRAVRKVPVHRTLAALLDEWRVGWAAMFGREPTDDDLIIPLPPEVKRTKRTGERFRGWDYMGRRWREEDEAELGWRHRSVYDTKSTFITLAIEDGADPEIIRDRVTHAKPRRDAFDGYDRGPHWKATCREVSKLRIRRLVTTLLPGPEMPTDSDTSKLRRRVSNDQSGPPELRVIQGGREVIPTEHDLSIAFLVTPCDHDEDEASEATKPRPHQHRPAAVE